MHLSPDLFVNLGALLPLFHCAHTRANAVEGKTFCPDCGVGLVFQWVILKCGDCGQRRPSGYVMRQVRPLHAFCIDCGAPEIETLTLTDPEFFQLRHALLVPRAETPPALDMAPVSAAIRRGMDWLFAPGMAQSHAGLTATF